jgi:uncharacterized membrane protein
MFVSGVGLIWTGSINVLQTGFLLVTIVLYVVAVAISLGIVGPATRRLVQIVEAGPQPGPGAPPPEVMTLVRRTQMFGGMTTLLFLAIIFLMIIQPGGITLR